eukprot:2950546-Amphidinium_carterae.1
MIKCRRCHCSLPPLKHRHRCNRKHAASMAELAFSGATTKLPRPILCKGPRLPKQVQPCCLELMSRALATGQFKK